MISEGNYGMYLLGRPKKTSCGTCIFFKQTKNRSCVGLTNIAEDHSTHMEICGLFLEPPRGGERYLLCTTTKAH